MSHALIVDDSKTARYALRQLLDKHQFSVDMVESAEQALDYLQGEAPDVIFMDHMMPGMDGFQAVKAIKSNPGTAAIPIVMYTSTQGGMYFGQARALGAADVIAKPATPEDLSAVLQRLEDHQLIGQHKVVPIHNPALAAVVPAPVAFAPPPPAQLAAVAPPLAEADSPSPHFNAGATYEPQRNEAEPVPTAARGGWLPWLVALLLLGLLWLGYRYYSLEQAQNQLLGQQRAAFKSIEWAFNQVQEYPYGEMPFSGDRLTRLQELVEQLKTAGFRGSLRLESHAGEFCLLHVPGGRDQPQIWQVAPAELLLTDCSALGQSAELAQRQSGAQSAAFKRFLKDLPQLAPGIRVEVVALGASEPLVDYPTDANVSAGAWNRVAQRNQRVQVLLGPEAATRDGL